MTLTATRPTWHSDPVLRGVVDATEDLLASAGPRVRVTEVTSPGFIGRNGAWVLALDSGERVFAKQISPDKAGPAAFDRSIAFASFALKHPLHAPPGPRLISSCRERDLLVFEHCPGVSLAQLLVDERIPAHFSAGTGRLLGRLHSGPVEALARTYHPSPPVPALQEGIPQERYVEFTLAEIRFWAELQQDSTLVQAAADLRHWESEHQTAPIHGDLRLDQFHLRDAELRVLDWEEFGRGDPARDLGTLAGEWIYRAVLDVVTSRAGAPAPPLQFDSVAATERITERMHHLAPQIRQMWTAYRAQIARADDELAVRATAHLGWHLVDRSIARASLVAKLPGIERAAAGVGRKILLTPGRYAAALGFEEFTS
ncbi:class V lanthionine synthetase subunit LxmK [Microbacterium sp.]|uniref:class V lanthionine synthetase subunit LxmK n=1 Tax=Microbacterium sp. TaxID=51671 RepID=UPI003A83F354